MDISIYLAKLLGPVLVIVGLSLLAGYPNFLGVIQDVLYSPTLLFLVCVLGLLGGVALILAHNVWVQDWRVIITLLGWWSAIESAVWLLLPRIPLQRLLAPILTPALVLASGVVVLLLGSILSYVGYLAPRQARGHTGRHP